jgi:hypothetical protein
MALSNTTQQLSPEQNWTYHISQWESNGLSQKKYCYQNGLNFHTFQYWRTRFNKTKRSLNSDAPLKIVEIKKENLLQENSARMKDEPMPIKLLINNVQILLKNNFNADALKRVIRVIKSV